MKLVHAPNSDQLQNEIRKRYAEFNCSRPPSKGRRYPRELKELVRHGCSQGLKVATLRRLTGLSSSAIKRWHKEGIGASAPPAPRRLAVTDSSPLPSLVCAVVVRLPSGVTIELSDSCALNRDLLAGLAALEVRHATSS